MATSSASSAATGSLRPGNTKPTIAVGQPWPAGITVQKIVPKSDFAEDLEGKPIDIGEVIGAGKGKGRQLVIGIPGAFTPVCSSTHLPGFIDRFAREGNFARHGVNEVVLVAPNDAYVMAAWAKSKPGLRNFTLIADGNAAVCDALGLSWDGTAKGMGLRSKRFVLVVDDGIVSSVNVETEPSDLRVTAVEYVLEHLPPEPQSQAAPAQPGGKSQTSAAGGAGGKSGAFGSLPLQTGSGKAAGAMGSP